MNYITDNASIEPNSDCILLSFVKPGWRVTLSSQICLWMLQFN